MKLFIFLACSISIEIVLAGQVPQPTTCRFTDLGQEYMGEKATTISGRNCQAWNKNSPHDHGMHDKQFPDGSEDAAVNFCRNPDASDTDADKDPFGGGPWCYTTDPKVRWEYCGIPYCDPPQPDKKTCSRGRCGNPCEARGLTCCYCDETKSFNVDACFCCPKGQFCCPTQTWAGHQAHCCPSGYTCSKDRRCTKTLDIKPEIAEGVCGFGCRGDTELYVTVDDKFRLLIDGVQKSLTNANDWTKRDVIPLLGDARVITICGENVQYKAGILLASAKPMIIEEADWKCISSVEQCTGAWSDPDFDDSAWKPAYSDEKNDGSSTRKDIVPGIPRSTSYKWCNNSGTGSIDGWNPKCTCRITLRASSNKNYKFIG